MPRLVWALFLTIFRGFMHAPRTCKLFTVANLVLFYLCLYLTCCLKYHMSVDVCGSGIVEVAEQFAVHQLQNRHRAV